MSKDDLADEIEAMAAYVEEQHTRCPLCGSNKVEVRYVEYPADFTGYWHVGDMFKCESCSAEGEYE
jgi:transposase-like protein